jgi:hypothetical protein
LDGSAVGLLSNLQCWRLAWEDYMRTYGRTKELKNEMSSTEPMVGA